MQLHGGTDGDVREGFLGISGGAGARDIIRDFSAFEGDKIDVAQYISDLNNPNNPFFFIGTQPIGTMVGGEIRYQQFDNPGTENDITVVQGEVGGDGGAIVDFEIEVKGLITFLQQDFVL